MNIGEACSREAYIVNPGEPLLQAVREMCRRNVGCVIVVERRAALVVPVGTISTDDLLGIVTEQLGSLARLVGTQTRSHRG